MLVQTYFPEKLAPARYDSYLASGWFRGSVMLYKMDLLCLEEDIFSVVNIRLDLRAFKFRKGQRKVMRRVESRFRIETGRAVPNAAKEDLYQQQKHKFKGFIHPTLTDYLNSGFKQTVFDTYEICVYDDDRLIAVSFFDRGAQAMASLLGLYDDSYSHFSLGYYTMLKEITLGLEHGFQWYYPGYVLDQPSQFNYKLRLGNFQFYNNNRRWASFNNFDPSMTLAWRFKTKISELRKALLNQGIAYEEVLYPLFSMGYVGYLNAEFVKYPAFLEVKSTFEPPYILSFDLDTDSYTVNRIVPAPNFEHLVNMEASGEFHGSEKYNMRLLLISEHISSTETAEEAVKSVHAS